MLTAAAEPLTENIAKTVQTPQPAAKEQKIAMNTAFLSVGIKGGRPRIACSGSWLINTGFLPNELVQALPEPNGISFTLCNDIESYRELERSTIDQNGKLIHVLGKSGRNNSPKIVTTGRYIRSGGLSIGDSLIVRYGYGLIRMRKIPGTTGIVGRLKDRRTEQTIPAIRLFGEWLAEYGFTPAGLVTACSEPGCITLTLHDNNIEHYSTLVKYVRTNKLKLFQIQPYARDKSSSIEISGSGLEGAGFGTGDVFGLSCEYGLIRLRKFDFKDLGF